MKKALALILALAMVFCLMAGCGSDKEDTGSSKKGAAETVTVEPGKYLAVSCVIDGEEYPCDQDWLEIEEGGSGALVFEGDEYSMDWTLSGSTFSFEDKDGSTFEGTYADGVIEGVLDGQMEYTFELEGGAAPAKKGETAAEPAAESGFTPVSGSLAGCDVTIVGAELFTDADDKDAIRVYWMSPTTAIRPSPPTGISTPWWSRKASRWTPPTHGMMFPSTAMTAATFSPA